MSNEIPMINYQIKISNFIKKNKKFIIFISISTFILLIVFFFYQNMQQKKEIKISEKYTQATILINQKKNQESKILLESIISEEHNFYSPLALYLIIDNNIEVESSKIIYFFDTILKNNSIDVENKNLIKIKKAIYLLNQDNEKLIIKTLNPVINSNSTWRSLAINIIVDYFLSKNEKVKAEEYIQLLNDKVKK